MISSKAAISLLGGLLLLAVFMANVLNSIATDHNFYVENQIQGVNFTKYWSEKYGRITDTTKNILWFIQISDIHISIFRDPSRISQFQQFCDNTVKQIKPSVVLATGDLTDAKAKDNLGSSQVKTEWVYYYNIIKESGVTDNVTWLDIRGNHDNFNIRTINSEENYFRKYSVQGAYNPKSYVHIENRNGVNIAFLGVDACPDPGLRRPFNFVGLLNKDEQQHILSLQAEAAIKADHIVWFGHYPTSCILSLDNDSEKIDIRDVIGKDLKSQVYVCGHLHAMGGLVREMYTRQRKGFLELELEDWKDNRMYRLAAIDHGIFSFVDQKHNVWPVILVTNPKHAQFFITAREPVNRISDSTHIRILAFSDVSIDEVKISFDKKNWVVCTTTKIPLYVCKWQPNIFTSGLHILYVSAEDVLERKLEIEHPFSIDGTGVSFKTMPRILLMLDAPAVFQAAFATLLLLNVLPLVILRMQKKPPTYIQNRKLLRNLWLLSKIDRIFYPIVLYVTYLSIGPWAIGEFIDGHIGVIFAWGILIKGILLPEPFTYMYGGVQLMFVHLPLKFVLASCLQKRLFTYPVRGLRKLISNLPFVFLLSIQMLFAYFFWLEYGTLGLIFGPLRTWSIPLSILLWYKTISLPPEYCRKLLKINEGTT